MSCRGRYILSIGGIMSGALYLGGIMTVKRIFSLIRKVALWDETHLNLETSTLTIRSLHKG